MDAEVERAKQIGTQLDLAKVSKIMGLLKIGVKLGELRDDLHEDENADLAKTAAAAAAFIKLLDNALHESGLLQAAYSFNPDAVIPEPAVMTAEMANYARHEDFTHA